MARGETEEEVIAFLEKIKRLISFDPFFVVIDFSQALITAVKKVFPKALIGHDYFHVSQLLNTGLLKEMTRRQKLHFMNPIKDYNFAAQQSLRAEKEYHIPNIKFKTDLLTVPWQAYQKLFKLNQCLTYSTFQKYWTTLKIDSEFNSWKNANLFFQGVEETLPACGLTHKNFKSVIVRCFQIWRRIIRREKQELSRQKKGFSVLRYYILTKPGNLKASEYRKLRMGLQKFEFLKPIRDVVCLFHEQFKEGNKENGCLKFLKTLVNKDSHPKLVSVVQTLMDNEEEIFNYRRILTAHPELKRGKSIRSNHEEINRRLKQVSRNQYGLRISPNAAKRMNGLFRCPVFISDALRKNEEKDL